jgi:hypothetical protein
VRRVLALALPVGLVVAGAAVLVSRLFPTDAQRIARLVEYGRYCCARRDLAGVMSVVDSGYSDEFGMDFRRLQRWFGGQFRNYDSIVCVVARSHPVVSRGSAVCSLTVGWAGFTRGRGVPGGEPEIADGFPIYRDRLVVHLRRTAAGWRVVGAGP